MRKFTLSVCLGALALLSACSDGSGSSSTAPATLQPRANIPVQPVCLSADSIGTLLDAAFVNGSPDENSALGKWDNIKKQQAAYLADPTAARRAVVQDKVIDLVDFILDKKNAGKLLTGADEATLKAFADLVNALFCYAQLSQYYYPGGTAFFVYPSDLEQSLVDVSLQAAMHLPANAVSSPSLIAITRSNAALATKLDQYGQTWEFSKYPIEDFAKPVVTEICVTVETPELFDKLVLGHTKSDGSFELLPEQSPRLACTPPPATTTASLSERLLSFLLPKQLFAAVMFGGGGVAGSLIELSPVRPVDPRIRVTMNTTGTSAPIGGEISPAPSVTLTTLNGTAFDGVPVAFSTTSGTIAPSTVTSTSVSGIAGATSWTLGSTPGAVSATATPQVSGSATSVPGVYFVNENLDVITSVTFNATATAPTKLVVTSAPANGTTFTAGVVHTPATVVQVQDQFNRVVPAFTGAITMNATAGSTAQAFMNTATMNATAGVATFGNLAITKAGTFSITPSGSYDGNALPVTGAYGVTIVPAAGIITRALPLIGDTVTTATQTPRVRVVDAFDNPLTGQTVYWQAFGSAAPPTSSIDANGNSSVTWTLQEGPNALLAALDSPASTTVGRSVDFNTFFKTRSSGTLQSCAVNQNRADLLTHGFRFTALPGGNNSPARLDSVKFYFSVTGAASEPRVNKLRLIATQTGGGLLQPKIDTFLGDVLLKGNASQDAPGLFRLGGFTPVAGATLELRIERAEPSTQGTLRFNTGSCNNTRLVRYLLAGGSVPNPASVAYQLFGR